MVQARYVRVWPLNGHHSNSSEHSIVLRVKLLGCKPRAGKLGSRRGKMGSVMSGLLSSVFSTVSPLAPPCPGTGHRCASGECAPQGGPCDGTVDCEDSSDEEGCAPLHGGTTSRYGLALGCTRMGKVNERSPDLPLQTTTAEGSQPGAPGPFPP